MQDANQVTYFAQTDARGKNVPFGIKRDDRSRHMYVIGKTGMGKSTLLENLAIQDIQRGEGLTFIDPHGGTAEKLLDFIPEERVKDVLYFAPFDLSYPVSFNVLENVDPDKRHLVVNGLMATFEKIWVDAWSARMAYILQNTLGALLEWPDATLLGVNRMYTDKEYRKKVVDNVTDPSVKAFWVEEFAKYTDRFAAEATPAIQNKIGQFASNALVRNIIGQPQSSFNMREILDKKKIFIVNLSKGRVGEGNANLLGSMLITKLYLAAMSRADASASEMRDLPPHYLYVDEFQSFANRSFADILSEARKYKLALTIAHQYIEQMEEEVRAAVFGNVGTMITFRVGSYDAEVLEKEFSPIFTMTDIVNLGRFQIYLKLMIDGVASQPFSATTTPSPDEPKVSFRTQAIAASRARYSRPRAEVEEEIRTWHGPEIGEMPLENPSARPARKRPSSNEAPAPREGLRALLSKTTGESGRAPASGNAGARESDTKPQNDLKATLAAISKREQEKEEKQERARPERRERPQHTQHPERKEPRERARNERPTDRTTSGTRPPEQKRTPPPGDQPDPIREGLRAALHGLGVKPHDTPAGTPPEPVRPGKPHALQEQQRTDGGGSQQGHATSPTPQPQQQTPPQTQRPQQPPVRPQTHAGVTVEELERVLNVDDDPTLRS